MRSRLRLPWAAFFLLFCAFHSVSQSQQSTLKTCVAVVANPTTQLLSVERMTERLTKGLTQSKFSAVALDSATTMDRELHLTLENGQEVKSRECDYVVLTQVRDPQKDPAERGMPPISIGRKIPSVDASDPMGGQSGPVYRDNLEIDFALFRVGNPTPKLNTYLLDRPSANVSDSLMAAMDREANRLAHELKKQK